MVARQMLRPYTDADLEATLDAWFQASLVAHHFLTEEFLTQERRAIAEQWMPIAETTVCEVEGRVVGFISMIDNEVGAIFVQPDHQGRGFGRALMDHARQSRPYLELGVFEANEIGRRFYDAYGFEVVERLMKTEAGLPELRMRLEPDE
jgi:putative acetyltransferase